MNSLQLKEKAQDLRRRAFEMAINAGKGHLGGSLSCTEILVSLYYGGILRFEPQKPDWEERDRFILSKGHANNTLYVLLADLGFFPEEELSNFSQDGSILGGHCDPQVPGIEIVTGSLGHGLGIAAGIALGAALDGKNFLTFVVTGDGECQEGSIWEAAMFAGHHSLSNLVTFVDRNRLGSEEFTENSASLEPLADKWKAFGWEVKSVDGHSVDEILEALKNCRVRQSQKPLLIIANTVKGKGISCLENTPKSHHTLPKGEDIERTRRDLA
ncbi:MAG: transketolase [Deltaproteobacteria bacterium]|nr:transketolase [Deltaproteobacteria bacterium]